MTPATIDSQWAHFSEARATVEWDKLVPISRQAALQAIGARRFAFYGEEDAEDPDGTENGRMCAMCNAPLIVDEGDWSQGVDVCCSCDQERAQQGQADRVVLLTEVARLNKLLHDERNKAAALVLNVNVLLLGIGSESPLDPELIADIRECVGALTSTGG